MDTLTYRLKYFLLYSSKNHIESWSDYSLDMLPIEHVWDFVRRRLARDPYPSASKDALYLRIEAIWKSPSQADIQQLFDSMARRIAVIVAARGG